MERLSGNIADRISVQLNLGTDKKEVIAYGTFAILHMILSIMLVALFGLIFHVMVEALIISFTGSTLRKYSGGVHASSPRSCTTIGTIICVGQALLLSQIVSPLLSFNMVLGLCVIIFTWAVFMVYKLAPVDSPSKPIKRQEKRIRMKRGSIIVLCAYFIIIIIMITLYLYTGEKILMVYSLCVYGGIVWQVFTLTKLGHITLKSIDTLFNQIFILVGRKV